VGPRAEGYRPPVEAAASLLPDLPQFDARGFAALDVTMPRGEEFAAAVQHRAAGR
jgi:hypothetical protein